MSQSTSGFSDRYLAQVEAERQYLVHRLEGAEDTDHGDRIQPGIAEPFAARLASMPTVEEAYLSVFAENRKRDLEDRVRPPM